MAICIRNLILFLIYFYYIILKYIIKTQKIHKNNINYSQSFLRSKLDVDLDLKL